MPTAGGIENRVLRLGGDDHGIRVGRKRVARLMRQNRIRGAKLRKYVVTTQSDPQAPKAIYLVERRFFADAPDQLWVADMTYIPTWSGWLCLAMVMVMDMYSRKIVGWAMDTNMRTELILDALQMALTQRQPRGVIHHSDRGSHKLRTGTSPIQSKNPGASAAGGGRLTGLVRLKRPKKTDTENQTVMCPLKRGNSTTA